MNDNGSEEDTAGGVVSVNKLDGNVYPTRQAESAQTDVQQPPVQTEESCRIPSLPVRVV